ncbi:MAG: archaemetzincin family Zn-dependent metalloprotease [Candidatus Methanospirare jalkutatii]|nr:MAG: archaemetzincin family Zn-dependent metalloprotease [Candidatus Methanospirare jalkutatii]UYZ40426.1 MAG: archaemetzincin family Zn-dependent metalloprotease [Candidatus Methanospirare jalkutatii]
MNPSPNILNEELSKIFGSARILGRSEIPKHAFNHLRMQYNSTVILYSLPIPSKCDVVLAVLDADIYAEGLNFVFGGAELDGRRAIISLFRLKWGVTEAKEAEEKLKERALKEAVHEIGHVLGLSHCPNRRCVMHFSNSLLDTDIKSLAILREVLAKACEERFKFRGCLSGERNE